MNEVWLIVQRHIISRNIRYISVFDIALKRVKGDSTRAERLKRNIMIINDLDSDSVLVGTKIKILGNLSGTAIKDIHVDGSRIYFA